MLAELLEFPAAPHGKQPEASRPRRPVDRPAETSADQRQEMYLLPISEGDSTALGELLDFLQG